VNECKKIILIMNNITYLETTKNSFTFLSKPLFYLIVFLLTNTTVSYSQVICDIGNKQLIHQTSVNEEYSGLAYSSIDNVFLMPMDDPITGNFNIKGYDLNSNQSFNVGINGLNDNDLEGLTYLEDNYFALIEEDKNEVYFLKYNNNTQNLTKINSVVTGISLASTGDGLEGITYDPHTNRLFFVREHFNRELFSATVVLPTNNSQGSIGTITSALLEDQYFNDPVYCNSEYRDSDASGLHHLGQNFDSSSPFANHILIVSEGNKKIVEFEVLFNASNTMTLNYLEEEFILGEAQPEGITVVGNQLYIVSERGCPSANVSLSSYSINGNMACADPCNPVLGCTDDMACNYNPIACEDDGSCLPTPTCNTDLCMGDVEIIDPNNPCQCIVDVVQVEGCMNASACNFDATANCDDGSCYGLSLTNLNIKIYLEGPYNEGADEHTTELSTVRKLLPGQTPTSNLAIPTPAGQPYNTAPWNYTGTEGNGFTDADYTTNDVDWVLVSLRSSEKLSDEKFRAAGILQKNGTIRFLEDLCLTDPAITSYYIVVEHRNHLPVMTPTIRQISNNELVYDFTVQNSFSVTGAGQKQLDNGKWAAFAGNVLQISTGIDINEHRDDITGQDKAEWLIDNGVFDIYLLGDMNLDGDVNGQDKTLWFENNGTSSRVFHTN